MCRGPEASERCVLWKYMDGENLRALGDSIAVTVAAIDRTDHRLMALLREFDDAGGWRADGQTSFAAWLLTEPA